MNTTAPTTAPIAIFSLIFGILSWCVLPFVGAIGAVICGHIARAEIRRAPPGTLEGDGLAIGGLILGYLHLALIVMLLMFVFVFLGGLAFFAAHMH